MIEPTIEEFDTLLEETCLNLVKKYLLEHESDIALGINDFRDLNVPFMVYFGREAQE